MVMGLKAVISCLAQILLAALVLSCARSPIAPDPAIVSLRVQADFPEAWSNDGKLIAFRRIFPSNYGPPGIYLIDPAGGPPRWLCPATFFFPTRLRFSPDDRTLLAFTDWNLQLIDVQTGAIRQPLFTNGAVTGGDWIDGGRRILYFCSSYDPQAPADSSWIHILDLESGSDRHVLFDGRNLSLESMHTGPDGRVAAIENGGGVVIIDPTAAHIEVVYNPNTSQLYRNLQWWIRPGVARCDLIFEMTGHGGWSVRPGGHEAVRFAPGWNQYRLMSPDGEAMVTGGTDPHGGVGVLHIASVDDISGASHRPLTTFPLPQGTLQQDGYALP